MKKRFPVWIVFVLPLVSVGMGVLMFYLAFNFPDPEVEKPIQPLSKTSYTLDSSVGDVLK